MRNTCAECPHLYLQEMPTGTYVGVCGMTDALVPQDMVMNEITFWRVPMACPLDDDSVFKSENKAPANEWVKINVTECDYEKKSLGELMMKTK